MCVSQLRRCQTECIDVDGSGTRTLILSCLDSHAIANHSLLRNEPRFHRVSGRKLKFRAANLPFVTFKSPRVQPINSDARSIQTPVNISASLLLIWLIVDRSPTICCGLRLCTVWRVFESWFSRIGSLGCASSLFAAFPVLLSSWYDTKRSLARPSCGRAPQENGKPAPAPKQRGGWFVQKAWSSLKDFWPQKTQITGPATRSGTLSCKKSLWWSKQLIFTLSLTLLTLTTFPVVFHSNFASCARSFESWKQCLMGTRFSVLGAL